MKMNTRSLTLKICFLFTVAVVTSMLMNNFVKADDEEIKLNLFATHPRAALPLMPIEVRLTVVNNSGQEVTLGQFPPSESRVYVKIEDIDGKVIYDHILGRSMFVYVKGKPPVTLEDGNKEHFFVYLKTTWNAGPLEPIFSNPGKYRISFRYHNYFPSVRDAEGILQARRSWPQSAPENINITIPEEYEDAFRALKELSEPNIILEPQYVLFMGTEEDINIWERELTRYLGDHGDSAWAPLAWLARAHIAGRREDYQNQLDYAERAVETAETHEIDYTRRRALELKEHALRQLGETERAREIRRQLQAEERERRGLGTRPTVPEVQHPDRAAEQLRRTYDRLEAEGYDPRGLRELAPEAWQEFTDVEQNLFKRYGEGEISVGEFYGQAAEALERITREHLDPIPQEELRERIRRREEEREEMVREARERFNRWREENPKEYEEMLRRMEEEARRGRQPDN